MGVLGGGGQRSSAREAEVGGDRNGRQPTRYACAGVCGRLVSMPADICIHCYTCNAKSVRLCTQAMQSALGGEKGARAGWLLGPGSKEAVARDLVSGDSCRKKGPAPEGSIRRCPPFWSMNHGGGCVCAKREGEVGESETGKG